MSHQNFISLRTIHGCEMYQIRTWYDHSHYHYTSHLLQTTEYHYHYCIIISFMRHVSEFSIFGSVFATVTQTTHMFTYHSPINIYSMIRTSTESSCPWILGKAPQDIPSCFGELNATLRRPIQIRNFVNFLALDCSNTFGSRTAALLQHWKHWKSPMESDGPVWTAELESETKWHGSTKAQTWSFLVSNNPFWGLPLDFWSFGIPKNPSKSDIL